MELVKVKEIVKVHFRHPDGSIMTMPKGMSAKDAAEKLKGIGLKITGELDDNLFTLCKVH